MAAADKTAGQIVTTTGNGSNSSDANTTTTANNTSLIRYQVKTGQKIPN